MDYLPQASQGDAIDAQAHAFSLHTHSGLSFKKASKRPQAQKQRALQNTPISHRSQKTHRHNKTDATSCDARAQRIQQRPQHETHKHSKKCSVHSYYY